MSEFDDSPPVSPSLQTVGKVRIVSEEFYAEHERMRDLLRWRDAEAEKPEPDSLVLVNLIEKYAGRIPVRVMRYSERCEWIDPNVGIWMDRDVNYWRPIGPLPGGE